MNDTELYKLYEKLYFHELEIRDKLIGRLQISLTVIAILLGFLAFMLRNKADVAGGTTASIFWILFIISIVLIAIAIIFFMLSWYGSKYKLLPTASDTDKYKDKLFDHYKEYENSDELAMNFLHQYLFEYFRDWSSENTIINDKKSFYLYLTNLFVILSLIFSFLSFMLFYFGKLDKSNYPNPQRIIIQGPIETKCIDKITQAGEKTR